MIQDQIIFSKPGAVLKNSQLSQNIFKEILSPSLTIYYTLVKKQSETGIMFNDRLIVIQEIPLQQPTDQLQPDKSSKQVNKCGKQGEQSQLFIELKQSRSFYRIYYTKQIPNRGYKAKGTKPTGKNTVNIQNIAIKYELYSDSPTLQVFQLNKNFTKCESLWKFLFYNDDILQKWIAIINNFKNSYKKSIKLKEKKTASTTSSYESSKNAYSPNIVTKTPKNKEKGYDSNQNAVENIKRKEKQEENKLLNIEYSKSVAILTKARPLDFTKGVEFKKQQTGNEPNKIQPQKYRDIMKNLQKQRVITQRQYQINPNIDNK